MSMRANAATYTAADTKPEGRLTGTGRPALSVVKRCIYVMETGDWDKEIVRHEKALNRFCGLVIAVAVLYFLPVLFSLLAR